MKASMLIIIIFEFALTGLIYSQNNNNKNIFSNLYLKAGYEFATLSNSSYFKSGMSAFGKGGVTSYSAAVGYDYTKKLQFEIQYKYMDGFNYSYERDRWGLVYPIGASYYKTGDGSVSAHLINLRSNYFVNEDKRENPVYFIWSLNFGLQKVFNHELFEYSDSTVDVTNKYDRFVIGPEAGFGIYFDFGIFGFQTEFTFSSRFSPMRKDKRYTENSLILNFSPVINF